MHSCVLVRKAYFMTVTVRERYSGRYNHQMFRCFLLLSLAGTGVLWSADLSGNWQGVLEINGKKGGISLTVKQENQSLSGTLSFAGETSRNPIEHADLSGDELTFEIHDAEGRKIHFTLAFMAGKMAGEASIGDQVSKIQMVKTSSTAVYRVGGAVSAPVLIRKVEPEYPDEARSSKLEGVVVLYVEVNSNGDVTNPRIIRGLGNLLDQKAIECVNQWKFKPGYKIDWPVTVAASIEVKFGH